MQHDNNTIGKDKENEGRQMLDPPTPPPIGH
jgi:hypothetical protein